MAATFNSSADDAFRELTGRGLIASINPLIDLRPSALDLTTACLATLDLSNRNGSTDRTAQDQQVGIGAAFLQLVPSNFTRATVFDAIAYWQALGLLPGANRVVSDAIDSCRTSNRLTLALDDLDLSNDCPSTSDYWWRFIAPKEPDQPPGDSDNLNLVLPALPPRAQTYSNATILTALPAIFSGPTARAAINSAADGCTAVSCLALSYAGDADIGGLGALITYGCVAFFTTVVCFACGYYYRKDNGVVHMVTPGRRATVKSSLSYADLLNYYSIMAALASDIYLYTAQSFYEFGLAALVGCMAFCSVCVLAVVDLLPMDPDDQKVRGMVRLAALAMAQNVAIPALSKLGDSNNQLKNWIDMPCYGNYMWPKIYIAIGCGLTIGAWVPYTILTMLVGYRQWLLGKKRPIPSWADKDSLFIRYAMWAGFILALSTLWYCVVAIIYIRQRSSQAFGGAFDNNFGYGQIIASGFMLQVIVQFAILRAWPYLQKKDSSDQLTQLATFKRRENKLERMSHAASSTHDGESLRSPAEGDPQGEWTKLRNAATGASSIDSPSTKEKSSGCLF